MNGAHGTFREDRLRLETGEPAVLVRYQPDGSADPDWVHRLWDVVVCPYDPWISRRETTFLTRMLKGEFAETNADLTYSVWIDGQPAAHAAILRAAENREVGLVAYVLTDPAFRGRGLSPLLMARMMRDFVDEGGRYALLSTGNPTARAIYARHGFEVYNGHVMRYVASSEKPARVDGEYFALHGPARMREAHWGDGAGLAWLYAKPSRCFVKDYTEALYDHPALEYTRCGSILPSMMLNVEQRAGGLWLLETAERRVVGAATLTYLDSVGQTSAPVVDFLIVPAYGRGAFELLARAGETARAAGAEFLRAYLASHDREKSAVLEAAGFRCESRTGRQFAAGACRYDLLTYSRAL